MSTPHPRATRRAFTYIELMIVVLIIGVLAAIALPRFSVASESAQSTSAQASLAAVRAAIASHRAKGVIAGTAAYPTLGELTAAGTVLKGDTPTNPFNDRSAVQSVTRAQAMARSVSNTSSYGWNYYVDNTATPPEAIFYANTTDATNVTNDAGTALTANQL